MKSRIIVAIIFLPIVFIILFFLPPIFLVAFLALVSSGSAIELMQAVGGIKNLRIKFYLVLAPTLLLVGIFFNSGFSDFQILLMVTMYLILVMFIEAFSAYNTEGHLSFSHILIALFAGAVLPMTLVSLLNLRIMPAGRYLVFIPVICAFLTDAGAYFAGYFFGKRKAFPEISPKKTVEGCIGGLFAGAAMLLLFGILVMNTTEYQVNLWLLVVLGIVGAAATQIGDLAFSLVKREYNVKDFGKLLPGHGGMLDRFDSLFFAAPIMYLMIVALPSVIH